MCACHDCQRELIDLTFAIDIATSLPYLTTDYIMLELLKNSMRATVEWHGVDGDFPPIKIVIADGSDNEDVVIKVSDEGTCLYRIVKVDH